MDDFFASCAQKNPFCGDLVRSIAAEKGCAVLFVSKHGGVVYASGPITHRNGGCTYQTWEKSWCPSRDPEIIKMLQDSGLLSPAYIEGRGH